MSRRSPLRPGPPPRRPALPAVLVLLLGLALCGPGPTPAATGPAADPLADSPPFSLTPDQLLAFAHTAEAQAQASAQSAGRQDEGAEEPSADDMEILVRTVEVTLREDGALTWRRHEIYRIATAAGAEAGKEASVDYSPWHQRRPTLRARVVTAAGRVHTLDPATISEVSLESDIPDVYQDRLRLRAPLPAVEPGAVVETLREVADTSPLFAAGTVHRQVLAAPAPVRHARVILDYPEGLPLRYLAALPPGSAAEAPPEAADGDGSVDENGEATGLKPRVSHGSGRVHVVYELHDVASLGLGSPGLPPDEPRYPYVAFTTGRSWGAVARAYSAIVDAQIAASDLGNVKIAGDDLGSQWEQIAARVAWMQRSVRYTGVNLGDAAIVPRPPAQTLARRYGDCKDKATLLVAALREIGVPAYVALLRAGSPDDLDEELPGLGTGSFDHAIVYVPGSPALWIDATDPYSMLGELPTPDQGRLALVASPNTEGLVHTPVSRAEDNRITETREVTLEEFGPGHVVESSEMIGAPARQLRSGWDGVTDEQIVDGLKSYAKGSYGSTDVTDLQHRAADDVSGPMTMHFEVGEANWALTDLLQGFVAIPVPTLLQRFPYAAFWKPDEGDPARRSDFIVREPHEVVWHYVIHVPEGFAVRELPEGETRDLGPARYTSAFEQGDGEVRATFTMKLAAHRLSPDQLGALRDGVATLQGEGNLLLWFDQVGMSHLAAGEIGSAFDELRRLAALHPDEALHHVQLAQVALAAGVGEEARRQAEKAVELEPDWYVSQQVLGLVLLHGPAGRQFGVGYDRAGALAAYQRARELEPDESQIAINLALLYEHDDQGRRYQDPDGLAEAIDVYRSVQDKLVGTNYENNLAFALLFAERNQEAFDLLQDATTSLQTVGLLAAAEAVVKTPQAAIRRVDHAFSGDRTQRAQALIVAGQSLAARRHYPEAAALYKAASTSAENPAQIQSMVQLLEKAHPWQELTFAPDSPASLLPELLERAARVEEIEPSDVADLLAEAWTEDLDSESLAGFVREEAGLPGSADEIFPGSKADVMLDLIVGIGKIVPTELPGIGWALRIDSDLPIPGKDKGMIVVRQHGGFRLAATEDDPGTLGRYAFALAHKGDADAARPWLDRAYELTEAPEERDTLPSAEGLFHTLWTPGASEDAGAVEVAAAVLAAGDFADGEVVKVLRKARERATDEDRQLALDQALAAALINTDGDDELLLEVGRRIEQATDEDLYLRIALSGLKRYDTLRELADRDLEKDPNDLEAAALRAQTYLEEGKLDRAAAAYQKIAADPNATSSAFNQAAWLDVARDTVDEQTVQWAQQAAKKSDYGSYPALHTLATVYATIGRPEEAYKVLLQAIGTEPQAEPRSVDWYVFGQIAEQYGLKDAARTYYARVEKPEDGDDPAATWYLAQRRLKALGG